MTTSFNRRSFIGGFVALGTLTLLNPNQAIAITAAQKQEEVRAVKAQLEAMAESASAAGDRYHQAMDAYDEASARIEEARATIADMTERIAGLQERLDVRATAMYRAGATSYLDVLLGVRSFEDFATVWDMLNNLNAEDADLVASTKVARSTLETAQDELVTQQERVAAELSAAESYMNQALAKQDEYDRLYNNLSAEYQQILAEQEAAEAQASARAPQEFVPTPVAPSSNSGAPSIGSGSSAAGGVARDEAPDDGDAGAGGNEAAEVESPAAERESSVQELSTGTGAAPSLPTNASVVDYAYSKIGCPYVWGAKGPEEFDCSGFVAWCYRQVGISLPSYTESLYATAAARFSPGEAQPGDVLYKPGHVGISTGGINCVEAMGSRWGVVESYRGGWTAALRF